MKSLSAPLGSDACPCCGFVLPGADSKASKSLCGLCWWQDDGLDNAQAFAYSQANKTNLNLARHGFLKKVRKVKSESARTRFFRLDETGSHIEELDGNGKIIYRGPIPFVEYIRFGKDAVAAAPLKRGRK